MLPTRFYFDNAFDQLFGNEGSKMMNCDIYEKDNTYHVEMDLPGYEKENISLEINDGYLMISAKTSQNKDEKEEGKYVRKERFVGECSRSFYVGDNIKEEDIKAAFKNGTLKIEVPKKEERKELPEKKQIPIE